MVILKKTHQIHFCGHYGGYCMWQSVKAPICEPEEKMCSDRIRKQKDTGVTHKHKGCVLISVTTVTQCSVFTSNDVNSVLSRVIFSQNKCLKIKVSTNVHCKLMQCLQEKVRGEVFGSCNSSSIRVAIHKHCFKQDRAEKTHTNMALTN